MAAPGVLAGRFAWCLAAAAGLVTFALPSPAQACGACGCDAPYGIRPQLGNNLAPQNARFLLALHHLDGYGGEATIDPDDITWTDTDGNAVEFDVVPTDGEYDEVWLVPKELLTDSTDYRIAADYGAEYPLENFFTTDTYADETAPDGPPATAEPITASAACGDFHGARLSWQDAADDAEVMGYEAIVEVRVESGDETAVIFADATNLYPGQAVDLAIPGSEESVNCWGTLALPFEPLTVTAKLYDWAGNTRSFDPVEVTLEETPGGTCPGDGSDGSSDGDAQRGGGMCGVATPSTWTTQAWTGCFLLSAGVLAALRRRPRAARAV